MANPSLQKTVIDGVDVSSYVINWTADETLEKTIRTLSVNVKTSISTVYSYEADSLIGKTIEVYRGVNSPSEQIIFRGYIRKTEELRGVLNLACEDKLSLAKYVIVNTSFLSNNGVENGRVSEIFKTLVNSYTSLIADNTSVQSSGTSAVEILKIYRLRQRNLLDGLQELATAIDWQFYYDPVYDRVFFEPKGYRISDIVLSTQTNIPQIPKWDFKSDQLFNQLTVVGSAQTLLKQEGPIKLDGSTANWNTTSVKLAFKPDTVKVLCDNTTTPTTEKKGGIPGMDTGYAYVVDKTTGVISWNTSVFAPASTYYATVQYTYKSPIIITRSDVASIAQYTGGVPKAITQVREDLQTIEDVANWAKYQLSIYAKPFVMIENCPVINESALRIGYMHKVDDPITGYTYNLMIKSLTMRYPYKPDSVTLTDQDYRVVAWGIDRAQRLRRIEEGNTSDTSVINTYADFVHSFKVGRRYIKITKRDLTGANVITGTNYTLGTNFVLGTALFQTGFTGPLTTEYLFPGDNYYQELAYDTQFYDAGSSTGVTWDTSAKTIAITGQLVSKPICIGPTVTACTVVLSSDNPGLSMSVSADDGASWTPITSQGVRTVINTPGTTFKYKIVNTISGFPTPWGTWGGSSTVTLSNAYKDDGTLDISIINILLETV